MELCPQEEEMCAAATIEEFLRDPVGRYVGSASFVGWCHSPRLCDCIVFLP